MGLGYRFSKATKLEFLYIRDWNRTSPEAEAAENAQAFDLRVKLFFEGEAAVKRVAFALPCALVLAAAVAAAQDKTPAVPEKDRVSDPASAGQASAPPSAVAEPTKDLTLIRQKKMGVL